MLCALGAVLLLLAVPAFASAAEFDVNTIQDGGELPAECGPGGAEPCLSLREAIFEANNSGELDQITFDELPAGSSVIEIEGESLPEIFSGVEIEGDTAAGAEPGVPAIELLSALPGEFTTGLNIRSGTGTRIEGLAIGGFEVGIQLGPTEGSPPAATQICGNYLGVALDGETTIPNHVGIEVESFGPENTMIGDPAVGCAGNSIVANTVDGVSDGARETTIAGNEIGIGPTGLPLPNATAEEPGSAGIFESEEAENTMIGGTDPSGAAANLIWLNNGPGVLVQGSLGEVSIRHDSFFANEGLGIEVIGGDQPAPTISSAVSDSATHLRVEGAVTGTIEGETVELDFYGSRTCASPGEGQTFLGSGSVEEVEVGSGNPYGVDLFVAVPTDERAITAAATRAAGATTEFSTCHAYSPYVPPTPPQEETKTQTNSSPPPSNPPTKEFTPTNGEKVVVAPEEGKVLIKLPGSKKFVPLQELKEIPVGAIIDATKGRVKLTSINPDGTEQSAEFFGGVFKVKQREGGSLVVLELLDTTACPAPSARPAPGLGGAFAGLLSFRPGNGTSGKLWGSGHGNFRTEGNNGSATVRGTIWLVEDRCNGTTFFRTRRGIVSVKDFVTHKTLPLPAGKTYVAGEE